MTLPILYFHGIIRKIETMSDGGLRIKVDTREMEPDKTAVLLSAKMIEGSFAYKVGEITPDEAQNTPEYVPEYPSEKSPAQRLRATLYRVWEAKDKPGSSESYYREKMDEIIEHFKRSLPD